MNPVASKTPGDDSEAALALQAAHDATIRQLDLVQSECWQEVLDSEPERRRMIEHAFSTLDASPVSEPTATLVSALVEFNQALHELISVRRLDLAERLRTRQRSQRMRATYAGKPAPGAQLRQNV